MENHIEFNRSNWGKVLEFTNNLAKDLIIERCINGLAYCKVPTREGYAEVKEGQFINRETDKIFYIMNPPPGYKSNTDTITLESVSNAASSFLLQSHITKLEAENTKLKTALVNVRDRTMKQPIIYNIITKALQDEI